MTEISSKMVLESNFNDLPSFTLTDEKDIINFDSKSRSESVASGKCVSAPQSELNGNLLALFLNEDDEEVQVHSVLAQLRRNGIRPFSDPRLVTMMNNLSIDPNGLTIPSEIGVKKTMSKDDFIKACSSSNNILNQSLGSNLVVPDFQEFCGEVRKLYHDLADFKGGKNADYIPQLSRANPDLWAIAVCTVDGQRFSIGDVEIPFCIQSCSKALNYAINVSEMGPDVVHKYLGKEPSGVGFNQIALDKHGLPHNPMINPGAISCCSVIRPNDTLADRFDHITEQYKAMAGYEFIGFSNATFLSEKSVADRNFAIAYFLHEHKVFPKGTNLKETLDLYFQLCSVEATADSAAVIAATLANGGECPTTREVCLSPDAVRNTLSLMFSCGMYDYSGEWSFEVGLPAKSGVAGSIFIVVPGVMGICVWSPPLDELGNSYRGVEFAKRLAQKFAFHQFDVIQCDQTKIDPRRNRKSESKEIQILNLISAANNRDMVLLHKYFEIGIDFNTSDYDNRTPLHLAVAAGHLYVVKFLVEKAKVDVNPIDRMRATPMDEAMLAADSSEEMIKYLRKKGAKTCEELLMAASVQY